MCAGGSPSVGQSVGRLSRLERASLFFKIVQIIAGLRLAEELLSVRRVLPVCRHRPEPHPLGGYTNLDHQTNNDGYHEEGPYSNKHTAVYESNARFSVQHQTTTDYSRNGSRSLVIFSLFFGPVSIRISHSFETNTQRLPCRATDTLSLIHI